MTRISLFYAALASASGLLIPLGAALNGGLGRMFGQPAWASAALLAASCLAAVLFALILRAPTPAWHSVAATPAVFYGGGVIIAFYALMTTFLTPRFGVANTVMFVLLAQLVSAALIDRFGLLGTPPRAIDPLRWAGLAAMLGGVVLCQWRR